MKWELVRLTIPRAPRDTLRWELKEPPPVPLSGNTANTTRYEQFSADGTVDRTTPISILKDIPPDTTSMMIEQPEEELNPVLSFTCEHE